MKEFDSLLVDLVGSHCGHRGQYAEIFQKIINSEETSLRASVILSKKPIIISLIEDSMASYILVCVVRSCLGRKTAGLLFRPLPAVRAESLKLQFKRAVLALLNRLPNVITITIMPFEVEPAFAKIARDWIYDPQFWDQHFENTAGVGESNGELAAKIKATAGGRKIVCAIGKQDTDKGFAQFVRFYAERPDIRQKFLFVSCGKVGSNLVHLIGNFEDHGGLVFNQFITDGELIDLYALSDLIWCCYDVNYDQASGIYGRAMQFGVPVILRRDSLIHKFSDKNGVKYITSADPIEETDLSRIPEREPSEKTIARATAMADVTIGRLRHLLGLPPLGCSLKGSGL